MKRWKTLLLLAQLLPDTALAGWARLFWLSPRRTTLTLWHLWRARWRRFAANGPLAPLAKHLAIAFAAAGAVTFFVNLALLFVPLYDMILYDRVLQSKDMDTVVVLTIGCAVGMIVYGILEYCRSMIFVALAEGLARRLNIPSLQAALAKSLDGGAAAASQVARDLNALRLFVSGPAAAIPLDLLWSPALVAILFMLHPAYGTFAVICAGILFALSLLTDLVTRHELMQANTAATQNLNELSAALRKTDLIEGMGMLPDVARRWHRRQNAVLDAVAGPSHRSKACAAIAKTARLIMQGGIIALGTTLVLHGQATPGSMMGANLLIAKLLLPFSQLVTGWRQWTDAAGAWQRLRALLAGTPPRSNRVPDRAVGFLEVKNLTYRPAGAANPILREVSFTVVPGEAVCLIGRSGGGKSTLARLIAGVIAPSAGEILLDGLATRDWDRDAFGRMVGYLPQGIGILDGTIAENIQRMRDDDPAHAVDAATRAGVHELIGRLPAGYATWIGGAGYALSGGQQQQVALARALYGNPKLLILDEPNASLDHEGEHALQQALEAAKRGGAALFLITHRPALLKLADRVLQLEDGRVTSAKPAEAAAAPPGLAIAKGPRLTTPALPATA